MEWKEKDEVMLGVVGGMGSYATLDFFERILNAFSGEKDWDKPRIIIDNYSTLPSRVRAILYDENADELRKKLSGSVKALLQSDPAYIVLLCHTSHYFLPDIIRRVPEADDRVLDLRMLAKKECLAKNYKEVFLLASEGTLESGIYDSILAGSVKIRKPSEQQLLKIRELIEAVKQNKISGQSLEDFKELTDCQEFPVILGCSELPALYSRCIKNSIDISRPVIDPLQCVIDMIVKKHSGA